jgi:hypothetical protein
MKILIKVIIIFLITSKVFTAELIYDVYGIQKFTTFEIGDNRQFLTYNNESIVLSNLGINGSNKCKGVVEIINNEITSNIMCRYVEENGDINYTQFYSQRGDSQAGVQKFEFVYGTGRWEKLVGLWCYGASSVLPEDKYMWKGKCDIPDQLFEEVKNYKKPD